MAGVMDLTGQTFYQLKVISRATQSKENTARFLCLCACGAEVIVRAAFLRSGHTKSCGCHKRALTANRNRQAAKHGHCVGGNSRTYQVWANMHYRCENPKAQHFVNYGGRGITVCERWASFENFLADMGEQPPGLSIERKNNDLGYSPDNCKWATQAEQAANKRSPRRTEAGKVALAANLVKARAAQRSSAAA